MAENTPSRRAAGASFIEAENPYVVGRPVQGKSFVGRAEVLQRITDGIAPAPVRSALLLQGRRRTGKTSVLFRLRETLAKNCDAALVPVFVDLQGLSMVRGEGEFWYSLAHDLWSDLRRRQVEVPRPRGSDFETSPDRAFRSVLLQQVRLALGGRPLLFLMDEFDAIKWMIDHGTLGAEVPRHFCRLLAEEPVSFLVASPRGPRDLLGAEGTAFFRETAPVTVGPLTPAEARGLVTEPVRPWYTLEESAVDEVLRLTGRQPILLQQLCSKLLDLRNERKLGTVTALHVREAAEDVIEAGGLHIGYQWMENDFTPEERLALAVLAREGGEAPVSAALVQQRLDEAGLDVAAGPALERLQARELIHPAEQGGLTFTVPLLRDWLTRQHFHDLAVVAEENARRAVRER
jgi:hypothetical protein